MDAFLSTDNEYIERRKTLIKQTWRAVEFGMGEKATVEFYDRLLSQFPEMRPLFGDTNMKLQSHKIYGIIKLAVRSLDDFESVVPVLERLGRRHANVYGLDRSHYRAFTDTFIEVLHRFIYSQYSAMMVGTHYAIDVADAWSYVLNIIGDIMADTVEEMPPAA